MGMAGGERLIRLLRMHNIISRGQLNLIVAISLIATAHPAAAQGYPFSQRSRMEQDIALTAVEVTYGRPVARGRVLWGKLVPWDSVWHPGADSATRISFSRDVVLEGKPLKAGEYSMWLIPRESQPWTFILSRAAHTFHIPYPGADKDVMRVDVKPEKVSHMETMAIYFSTVLRDSATMRIHWGETALPIQIKAPYKPD